MLFELRQQVSVIHLLIFLLSVLLYYDVNVLIYHALIVVYDKKISFSVMKLMASDVRRRVLSKPTVHGVARFSS